MSFAANLAVAKDIVIVLGTLTTISLGLYGLTVWKRDLVGKEVYTVTRNVIKQLYKVSKIAARARAKVHFYEHAKMEPDEAKHFKQHERWRISEARIYSARLDDLELALGTLDDVLLEARILLGSSVLASTLVFKATILDCIDIVDEYLDLLHDPHLALMEDSPAIQSAQQAMYPWGDLGDELSRRIVEAREHTELALLRYLHRGNIWGKVLDPSAAKAEFDKWKQMTEHRRRD